MRRILIIEDDNLIAELERDYLEASDFFVNIENDGKKGLDTLINGNYDALILDIMLPSLNGFEIAREIRKTSLIPIIMVTAKREEIDMVRGFGIGIDDYVLKPFSPSELVARVKTHLNIHEQLNNSKNDKTIEKLIFDELIIIPQSYQVFKNGKEIILTNKEFELLLYLAKNKNIVCSKEKLFDQLWGLDAYGELATIPVHINRIREKIEDNPNNPKYIQTVWGAGYKFKN
ncbi:MAG: response regulator transcription factor [Bacilli bacterium]|nr:response regulator transcription factor [Bacilli bacterium]